MKKKSNITEVMLLLRALAVFTGVGACIFLFFFLFPQKNIKPLPPSIVTPSPSNKFCGGVAGIPCPTGYRCKLEANYPDAGGTCLQDKKNPPDNCKCWDANQHVCLPQSACE